MTRTAKRQSKKLAPLEPSDALEADTFLKRNPPAHESILVLYRCRCGNKVELHIQVEAVTCVKCGSRMKPVA